MENTEQSTVLNEEEVQQALNEESTEDNTELPSDVQEFVMPEKFQGKSIEDIAKAYIELEKMKATKEDVVEEVQPKEVEEATVVEVDTYLDDYLAKGTLTDEQYAELLDKGMSREEVNDKLDYLDYKQQKEMNKILEPFGGKEHFEKVAKWASQTMSEQEIASIDKVFASGERESINALLATLTTSYKLANNTKDVDLTLHTNQPQTTPKIEGYKSKSEYFKDSKDPRYEKDPAFRKAVENKMALTDLSSWY